MEPQLPLYYKVRNNVAGEELETILRALTMHPVDYAIVRRKEDADYAFRFADFVICSENPCAEALDVHGKGGLAVVIGETEQPWEAVFYA